MSRLCAGFLPPPSDVRQSVLDILVLIVEKGVKGATATPVSQQSEMSPGAPDDVHVGICFANCRDIRSGCLSCCWERLALDIFQSL